MTTAQKAANHQAIAVIPARGRSKRVPRKNLHPIGGKPLIAHVIQAALASQLFARVVVSSEDAEILQVSEQAGAIAYKRPETLADDMTHVGPVVDNYLQQLSAPPDSVCLLYATALLLQPRHLQEAFALLEQPETASVLSITEFEAPIQRAYEMKEDGQIQMAQPEFFNWRSQDLPKRFRDAGMFAWRKLSSPPNGQRLGYIIPKTQAVDIDTPEDLLLAQALYEFFSK
jgi:pseudaminic acid cytidylyltransferase